DENLIALDITNDAQHPMATIFHEYTHLLTSHSNYDWPLWLKEGVAEFYSTFNVDKKAFTLGIPVSNHVHLLRESSFIPLKALIQVDHRSPAYNERDKQGIFYAESWALVHYLVRGN